MRPAADYMTFAGEKEAYERKLAGLDARQVGAQVPGRLGRRCRSIVSLLGTDFRIFRCG